jgi:hypothetical protein
MNHLFMLMFVVLKLKFRFMPYPLTGPLPIMDCPNGKLAFAIDSPDIKLAEVCAGLCPAVFY